MFSQFIYSEVRVKFWWHATGKDERNPKQTKHTQKLNKKLSGVIFYLMQIIPFKQFLAWDAKDGAFFAEAGRSVTLHVLTTSMKCLIMNDHIC